MALDRAAGKVPVAVAIGVAHEQHVLAVRDHALDAGDLRAEQKPVRAKPGVGAPHGETAGLQRERHELRVGPETDRLSLPGAARGTRGLCMP